MAAVANVAGDGDNTAGTLMMVDANRSNVIAGDVGDPILLMAKLSKPESAVRTAHHALPQR